MPIGFVGYLLIGVGMQILGYLLAPKPPQPKPKTKDDLKNPTAEHGKPITMVAGSVTVESPNNLGYWDKEIRNRKAKGGKK